MSLTQYLMDDVASIPIDVLWASLQTGERRLAFQMFEHGKLSCEGRILRTSDGPYESGFGRVFEIPIEEWRDADDTNRTAWQNWDSKKSVAEKLKLRRPHSDDVIAEIMVLNSELLREFVGHDAPTIPIDLYDDRFFKSTQTKMGAKVWARAASALANDCVRPTARSLAKYLLAQDIWPNGKISEDLLKRHLSPLISEFRDAQNS